MAPQEHRRYQKSSLKMAFQQTQGWVAAFWTCMSVHVPSGFLWASEREAAGPGSGCLFPKSQHKAPKQVSRSPWAQSAPSFPRGGEDNRGLSSFLQHQLLAVSVEPHGPSVGRSNQLLKELWGGLLETVLLSSAARRWTSNLSQSAGLRFSGRSLTYFLLVFFLFILLIAGPPKSGNTPTCIEKHGEP